MRSALRYMAYGPYALAAGAILLRWLFELFAVGEPECRSTEQGCPLPSIWYLLYLVVKQLSVPVAVAAAFQYYQRLVRRLLGQTLSERSHS